MHENIDGIRIVMGFERYHAFHARVIVSPYTGLVELRHRR